MDKDNQSGNDMSERDQQSRDMCCNLLMLVDHYRYGIPLSIHPGTSMYGNVNMEGEV
jgi:hypothetical protein